MRCWCGPGVVSLPERLIEGRAASRTPRTLPILPARGSGYETSTSGASRSSGQVLDDEDGRIAVANVDHAQRPIRPERDHVASAPIWDSALELRRISRRAVVR